MAREVKFRRGTTVDHSTFTGLEAEVTVDTTKDVVVVHDGVTPGGHPMAKEADIPTDYVVGVGVNTIQAIMLGDYDALNPPDPLTLYVILPQSISLSGGSFTVTGFNI